MTKENAIKEENTKLKVKVLELNKKLEKAKDEYDELDDAYKTLDEKNMEY